MFGLEDDSMLTIPPPPTPHPSPSSSQVLVSGRSGRVVGRPYLMEVCRDIGAINVTADGEIRLDCRTDQGGDKSS